MPRSTARLTIQQVAQEAGVSTQTVSRVLNDRPDVAPETRQHVQDVIARLGYQPSAIARGLVYDRTRTLGVITADFNNFFFAQVIASAELEARKYGYYLMLGSTELNPQEQPAYIRLLTERHVDGILIAQPTTESDERHLLGLLRDNVPVVTIAYHLPGERLTVVDVDNVDGGRQATGCLIANGHRRIAMITGPSSWKSAKDRAIGYRQALESAGIPYNSGLVVEADWWFEGGYRCTQKMLAQESFTALFAQNDQMAIGALRALHEAGRRVPEDIQIVGFDDIPVAAYCDPPLTTIRQPMGEIGALATRLLIQAIEEPAAIRADQVLLKVELIRRKSCL